MTNTYPQLGNMSIIEQVDLENLASAANKRGDTRLGGDSMGKRAGTRALVRLTSDDTLKEVFALGALSSDAWRVIDGSANITPVNIGLLNADFTIGADSAYAASTTGLLTTDGGNDAAGRVVQSVNLKAGTYFVSGTAAGEGASIASVDRPRLRVGTAAAGTQYGSYTMSLDMTYIHATAAESQAVLESFGFSIVLEADDEVFFTIDNVDEAAALQAGSSVLLLNKIEAQ